MALTRGTAATTSFSNVASSTFACTVPTTGGNYGVYVVVCMWNNGGGVTGVTYAGVALTKIVEIIGSINLDVVSIWGKAGPSTGANNVIITPNGNMYGAAYAIGYSDNDPTTPWGTGVGAQGNSTTSSVTVTTATGQEILDGVALDATNISNMLPGADQTELLDLINTGEQGAGSWQAGVNGGVMTWTGTGWAAREWSAAAVSIKPTSSSNPFFGMSPAFQTFPLGW